MFHLISFCPSIKIYLWIEKEPNFFSVRKSSSAASIQEWILGKLRCPGSPTGTRYFHDRMKQNNYIALSDTPCFLRDCKPPQTIFSLRLWSLTFVADLCTCGESFQGHIPWDHQMCKAPQAYRSSH